MSKPRIPITDGRFKYVNAARTDVAATFARIRREQAQAQQRAEGEAKANTLPIQKGKK